MTTTIFPPISASDGILTATLRTESLDGTARVDPLMPYRVHVTVRDTHVGFYPFGTYEEAVADKAARKRFEGIGCSYRLEGPCPRCKGVSQHPEIPGCAGCMACDFTGTVEGFEEMERLDAVGSGDIHREDNADE